MRLVNYHRLSRWLVPSTAEPWPIRLAVWRWMPTHPHPQYCRQRCSPHSRRGRKTDIQIAPVTADSPSRNARTRDTFAMYCEDPRLSTQKTCLVCDLLPQIVKRPSAMLPSLCLPNPDPLANASQILQGYPLTGAFGKLLGDAMIHVRCKALFSSASFSQQTTS